MKTHSVFLVYVLASLAALAPFAIDTYLPAFHVMAEALHADELSIQQSLTFYLLPYAMMTLCHGAISDAIGRITTLKWGLSIFVLASIGCAMAQDVYNLWIFRALQGASGGAGNTIARAMVRDLFEGAQAQKVMATVQILFGIAPAVAPVIGGALLGVHWQAIFLFLAIYAALSLWAAMHYLPETMPPEKRITLSFNNILTSYGKVFGDKKFTCLVMAVAANFSAFFIYVLASPVFLGKHLGLNPQQYGYLFVPTVTGMVIGSYIAKRVAGRLSAESTLKLAYGWMLMMTLINVILNLTKFDLDVVVTHIAPIALFNIGMALAMPVLSLAALDRHPKIRGTAASGQAFIQMLLSTVSAGLLIPLVWDSTLHLAFAMLVYLLIGLVAYVMSRRFS